MWMLVGHLWGRHVEVIQYQHCFSGTIRCISLDGTQGDGDYAWNIVFYVICVFPLLNHSCITEYLHLRIPNVLYVNTVQCPYLLRHADYIVSVVVQPTVWWFHHHHSSTRLRNKTIYRRSVSAYTFLKYIGIYLSINKLRQIH